MAKELPRNDQGMAMECKSSGHGLNVFQSCLLK